MSEQIFKSKKRIRLGVWGLGRGRAFYNSCKALNIDIVAGCDYNEVMQKNFTDANPDAFVTDNADEFLAYDMDAVLLATYCTAHCDDAIRCLEAGKHVLSEVTAFHTVAEGVRLVEAVEKSGLVYNLAENYIFTKDCMYIADKWKQGIFGELMYAEYDYLHEIRGLCYTYIDANPIQPGWSVHNWRSWISFHYYNTHALGPIMYATGTRPKRVTALPGNQKLAGYLTDPVTGMGGVCPTLIEMDNGGIVRTATGSTTGDSHSRRFLGTKASAEFNHDKLTMRLGGAGCGRATKMEVEPQWPFLGEYASKAGHGGGDFWVIYYFMRQILEGKPAPFDVYTAADCTLPGILAYQSSINGGKPMDVPDFRDKKQRDKYRKHNYKQPRYDVENGCFPKNADKKITGEFTTIMKGLMSASVSARSVLDWIKCADDVIEFEPGIEAFKLFLKKKDDYKKTISKAKKLAKAYPKSDGARVINEMLDLGEGTKAFSKKNIELVKKTRAMWQRKKRKATKDAK